jgi:thymidylate synthase
MHTHNFSLLGDTLHLTSFQRSCDVPLLLPYTTNAQYELMAA